MKKRRSGEGFRQLRENWAFLEREVKRRAKEIEERVFISFFFCFSLFGKVTKAYVYSSFSSRSYEKE